jgi:hypothetical protein
MMYPVKKLIRIDEAMNDGIDALARRQQTPVLTVTDAIRALICAWAVGTAEAPPEAEGGWGREYYRTQRAARKPPGGAPPSG